MKKLVFIILSLVLSLSSVAAFEGFSKESHTADGYKILLYQIDKEQYPDSFEFCVQLISNNSEECFTWCFENLAESMEHFKFLEGIDVVQEETDYFEHKKSVNDKRKDWRNYAFDANVLSNGYINYWISKKFRLAKNSLYDWR